MTDSPPTTGQHGTTNSCTNMAETEAATGSTGTDPFAEGHTVRRR
jgi:hypothetical protein